MNCKDFLCAGSGVREWTAALRVVVVVVVGPSISRMTLFVVHPFVMGWCRNFYRVLAQRVLLLCCRLHVLRSWIDVVERLLSNNYYLALIYDQLYEYNTVLTAHDDDDDDDELGYCVVLQDPYRLRTTQYVIRGKCQWNHLNNNCWINVGVESALGPSPPFTVIII